MTRTIGLIVLAALIALGGSVWLVSAAPLPIVSIAAVGSQDAIINQPVTLTLVVSDAVNLGAFEATVNTAGLEVQSVALGSFLASSGRSTALLPTRILTDNVKLGTYSFGNAPGATGAGTLATIIVVPRIVGTIPLTLTAVTLTDPTGGLLPATVQSSSVNVAGGAYDLDYNGRIDIADVQIVASRWLCATCYDARYDFDHDGDIDIIDVQTIAGRWGVVY